MLEKLSKSNQVIYFSKEQFTKLITATERVNITNFVIQLFAPGIFEMRISENYFKFFDLQILFLQELIGNG